MKGKTLFIVIVSEKVKYLGISLIRNVQDQYEHCKTSEEHLKKDIKTCQVHR